MSKVSVIVPAYQAEATLRRTLHSVLEQTHGDLEILVINDGSADNTLKVAEEIASSDKRIKLFGHDNAGVAASRNLGIERATGEFIAPIDADDIWHPRKLEMQLARLAQAGPQVGLVYNWYRAVNAQDHVRLASASPCVEGYCLHRHLAYNFIGNGSTPLIRRSALGDLRYEPNLALADAGGCEDYLLQLQIAKRWEFALVPAWLTGYRKAGYTMSSDSARMIRSHVAVFELLRDSVPDSARNVIRRRLARLHIEYVADRLRRHKPAEALAALDQGIRQAPLGFPRNVLEECVAEIRRTFIDRHGDSFEAYAFDQPDGSWADKFASIMKKLETFDRRVAGLATA